MTCVMKPTSSDTPLVSVIIPSYNHIDFVEDAIKSVVGQTYSNIELIVIDDGSSDGSFELLKDLSSKYEFELFSQDNQGLSSTLNKGVRNYSRGAYICALASDDYFHLQKIQYQVDALRFNTRSQYCCTQAIKFDTTTGESLCTFPQKSYSGNVLKKITLGLHYAGGSVMFSRKLFELVGGFDENLKIEDWDFSLRCSSVTDFTFIAIPLFYYRSHDNNTMKVTNRREIFHNKRQTLFKNYSIIPKHYLLFSLCGHFLNDYLFFIIKRINLKKYF